VREKKEREREIKVREVKRYAKERMILLEDIGARSGQRWMR
jgi:hypothetical protein